MSRRHHIIFGRRGSGKSSLLRKAASDLTVDRAPIAWVDLEGFKGHSYPDLLLSVLIATFTAFKEWLDGAAIATANRTSFWDRLFGKSPSKPAHSKKDCRQLSATISALLTELNEMLHSTDSASLKVKKGETEEVAVEGAASVGVDTPVGKAGAQGKSTEAAKQILETEEEFKRSKIDFLKRHIMEYQHVFDQLATISDGDAFLFLDDLYHIRKENQPQVVDYLHSIGKGHRLWLKVGTIRHRTEWYIHGNPPIGVKLGDDADEIDLDLTLEKYAIAREFLSKILQNLTSTFNLKVGDLLTEGAIDRLVLACGGVARDFLSIFRRSVEVARERQGDKISAEDINVAAGEYDSSKREEFKRDTYSDEEGSLDEVFQT